MTQEIVFYALAGCYITLQIATWPRWRWANPASSACVLLAAALAGQQFGTGHWASAAIWSGILGVATWSNVSRRKREQAERELDTLLGRYASRGGAR